MLILPPEKESKFGQKSSKKRRALSSATPSKDLLLLKVRRFLASRWIEGKPFLLGYSGGPDSKALLYLLVACQKMIPFELHLLHLDHGWREGSSFEAALIMRESQELGLVLHQHRLDPEHIPSANLEAAGREERILFFKKVYAQVDAQGLFLAHQADDQSETVLKRLLEGAHIAHWTGIEGDCQMGQMRVLRPLLDVPKKELIAWLQTRGKVGFEDPTNLQARFLRGRMRSEMIPLLAEKFGKEISNNLCKIADLSREMNLYLSKKCLPHFDHIRLTPEGLDWDLSSVVERIELNWILKRWIDLEKLHISRQLLEMMVDALEKKERNKKISIKDAVIYCNEGCLSYVRFC